MEEENYSKLKIFRLVFDVTSALQSWFDVVG